MLQTQTLKELQMNALVIHLSSRAFRAVISEFLQSYKKLIWKVSLLDVSACQWFPVGRKSWKMKDCVFVFNDIQVFWCPDCLQKHKENSRESYGTKEYKLLYATAHFKDCEQQRRHLSESHSLANNCRVKEQTCLKITRFLVVTMSKIA